MLKISSGDGRASLRFSQLSTNLFILHAHRRGKIVCKLFGGRQQSPRCERAMSNLPPPLVPCSCRFVPQVSSASVHQAFQMMRCRKSALPRLCPAVVLLDSSACCVMVMKTGRSMHPALQLIKSLVSQRRRSAS